MDDKTVQYIIALADAGYVISFEKRKREAPINKNL